MAGILFQKSLRKPFNEKVLFGRYGSVDPG